MSDRYICIHGYFYQPPRENPWLASKSPDVYEAIIGADKLSQSLCSAHGSAIAQVHNHMIMPLANRCDKQTQIVWGLRDFQHRFGRTPEGMRLAETAVDISGRSPRSKTSAS